MSNTADSGEAHKRRPYRSRLSYRFDGYMSRGGSTLFVVLLVAIAAFVLAMIAFRVLLALFIPSETSGAGSGSVNDAITAFLQTFDPGFMAGDIPSNRWYMGAAIVAGIGGIVLVAILTSIATTALIGRVAQLRRGHSEVVENEHTLILGWDEQRVLEIVGELAEANRKSAKEEKRRQRHAIVILADQDKVDMDDRLRSIRKMAKPTRIVTRSGTQWSTANLEMVSAQNARSAILLSECNYAASDEKKKEADARVIKTLLALRSCAEDRDDSDDCDDSDDRKELRVVVDLFNGNARDVSGFISDSVVAVDVKTVLAGVLLQTSGSVGLSIVYDELFSFRGAEFYLLPPPLSKAGSDHPLTFADACERLTNGIAVGITTKAKNRKKGSGGLKTDDADSADTVGSADPGNPCESASTDAGVIFNPKSDRPLGREDKLIIVAGDDSEIAFDEDPPSKAAPSSCCPDGVDMNDRVSPPDAKTVASARRERSNKRLLLVGWGPKTIRLLNEYKCSAPRGSAVDIVLRSHNHDNPLPSFADLPDADTELGKYFAFRVLPVDPTRPESWDPSRLPDRGSVLVYDRIIILSDGDREKAADVVDAKTIMILLILREAIRRAVCPPQNENGTDKVDEDSDAPTRPIPMIVTELVESDNQTMPPKLGVRDFVISSRIVSMLFAELSEQPELHEVFKSLFLASGSEIYIKPIEDYVSLPFSGTFGDLMKEAMEHGEICIGVKILKWENDSDKNHGVKLVPHRTSRCSLSEGDALVVIAEHGKIDSGGEPDSSDGE